MGFNMVERLLEKKHHVVVFDQNSDAVNHIAKKSGAVPSSSLKALTVSLTPPRLIWLMVPHQVVDTVLQELIPFLQKGDTVIDGGNSFYKDSMRRFKELYQRGIEYLDAGVSGGPSGAKNGACIMVGGSKSTFRKFKKLFRDLAYRGGYAYTGRSGSGHFVKMVHNGIEYGMMQAIAEGFALMKAAPFGLDLTEIAALYNRKSVIESRLIGWLKKAFEQHGEDLHDISGTVSHSGEGAWTVKTAKEFKIPLPIIEGALNYRIQSHQEPSYTGKILSGMRNQFGGHEVFKKSQ